MSQSNNIDLAVLIVDDEPQALKYFEMAMSASFTVLTASSADEAEDVLQSQGSRIAVVVTDQRMPGRTGASLLASVRYSHPNIIRVLTTAYSDLAGAIEAVNKGEVFRYITKPWNLDGLKQEMRLAIHVYELQQDRAELLAQKLSVKYRINAVERARNLIVISGALFEVPRIHDAVAGYVVDMAALTSIVPHTRTAEVDMWVDAEAEAAAAKFIAASMARFTHFERLNDRVASNRTGADLAQWSSRLKNLLASASPNFLSGGSPGDMVEDMTERDLRLTLTGAVRPDASDVLLFGSAEAVLEEQATDLLKAYIITLALGGNINTTCDNGLVRFEAVMPASPAATGLSDETELNRQIFESFERWD
jgi:DNA-binding NarL/FixJ family response regulator